MSQQDLSLIYLPYKCYCLIIKKYYCIFIKAAITSERMPAVFSNEANMLNIPGSCLIVQGFSLWTGLVQPVAENWCSSSSTVSCNFFVDKLEPVGKSYLFLQQKKFDALHSCNNVLNLSLALSSYYIPSHKSYIPSFSVTRILVFICSIDYYS